MLTIILIDLGSRDLVTVQASLLRRVKILVRQVVPSRVLRGDARDQPCAVIGCAYVSRCRRSAL